VRHKTASPGINRGRREAAVPIGEEIGADIRAQQRRVLQRGLPVQKSCPHANACLTCPVFLTGPEFLPELREQRHRTLALIDVSARRGHARVVFQLRRRRQPSLRAPVRRAGVIEAPITHCQVAAAGPYDSTSKRLTS
jgi:ferredoxin